MAKTFTFSVPTGPTLRRSSLEMLPASANHSPVSGNIQISSPLSEVNPGTERDFQVVFSALKTRDNAGHNINVGPLTFSAGSLIIPELSVPRIARPQLDRTTPSSSPYQYESYIRPTQFYLFCI